MLYYIFYTPVVKSPHTINKLLSSRTYVRNIIDIEHTRKHIEQIAKENQGDNTTQINSRKILSKSDTGTNELRETIFG